jgi:hypothetical protein
MTLKDTRPSEGLTNDLTQAKGAMVVAFLRHTLLPLDDCLYALQPAITRIHVSRIVFE